MTENCLAIVLKTAAYRDNDKMLTLLTAQKGKVSALARGARKPLASLAAVTDVFCCAEFSLYEKNGRYTVTQALLKNNFYNIRGDMKRLSVASAAVEMSELASSEEEENARLFALLASALYALDTGTDAETVFSFFSVKLLDILGLRPVTDRCAACGGPAADRINVQLGGAVCGSCAGEKAPEGCFSNIAKVLATPSKNICDITLECGEGFTGLMCRWMSSALLRTPKSLCFMRDMLKKP